MREAKLETGEAGLRAEPAALGAIREQSREVPSSGLREAPKVKTGRLARRVRCLRSISI